MPTTKEYQNSIIIKQLEKDIIYLTFKMAEIIPKTLDSKKDILLKYKDYLVQEKSKKLKNFALRVITLNYYNKNKILNTEITKVEKVLGSFISKETADLERYEVLNQVRNKLIKNLDDILSNPVTREFALASIAMQKIEAQLDDFTGKNFLFSNVV